MHCMYCSLSEGTCLVEATSSSEKITLVALAVVKLQLSEGRQVAGRQSIESPHFRLL